MIVVESVTISVRTLMQVMFNFWVGTWWSNECTCWRPHPMGEAIELYFLIFRSLVYNLNSVFWICNFWVWLLILIIVWSWVLIFLIFSAATSFGGVAGGANCHSSMFQYYPFCTLCSGLLYLIAIKTPFQTDHWQFWSPSVFPLLVCRV
jgi:hypothetical protein